MLKRFAVALTLSSLFFSNAALALPRLETIEQNRPPAAPQGKPCQVTSTNGSGSFAAAMKAALCGPERKKLKIFDHEFNVKPAEITREGNKIIIIGQISHHLSLRPDDQVYYRITKEGNTVKDIQVDIKRGGWAPLAAPIVSALSAYVTGGSFTVPPNKVEEVGRSLGRVIDGSWEQVAHFLIVNIALRAK
ncbi:hypothetical protein RIVM261_060360 [Rivularia sp. IAM M-261]|nr:hypothetical protein RIVM261_060360 [Rivularia sp. IAM M-261]